MRFRLTLLALPALFGCTDVAVHAATPSMLSAQGISLPIFDPAGKLTHKLLAKSGTMQGPVQSLQSVELQLFSPEDPTLVVQTLEAEDAVWDGQRQTLVGKGALTVTAADNRLSGRGFEYSLATSRLLIHQDFTLLNPELTLNSDRAIVDLVVERNDKDVKFRDVARCEAVGNVRIKAQPDAAKKFNFDHAFSERAVYVGETRKITFPDPIRTVLGKYEMTSQTMSISLNRPLKSAVSKP